MIEFTTPNQSPVSSDEFNTSSNHYIYRYEEEGKLCASKFQTDSQILYENKCEN